MKKVSLTLFIVIALAVFSSRGNSFYPESRAAVFLKKALKTKQIDGLKEIRLKDGFQDENRLSVYSFTGADQKISFAIFREAMGRHDKFEYLVLLNSSFEITQTKILKYRSEHGGEICAKKWLAQFDGFSGGSLKYGADISAISGATISAKSITADIAKVVSLVKGNVH